MRGYGDVPRSWREGVVCGDAHLEGQRLQREAAFKILQRAGDIDFLNHKGRGALALRQRVFLQRLPRRSGIRRSALHTRLSLFRARRRVGRRGQAHDGNRVPGRKRPSRMAMRRVAAICTVIGVVCERSIVNASLLGSHGAFISSPHGTVKTSRRGGC